MRVLVVVVMVLGVWGGSVFVCRGMQTLGGELKVRPETNVFAQVITDTRV